MSTNILDFDMLSRKHGVSTHEALTHEAVARDLSQDLKLRVLSGKNKGATVNLVGGVYSIGSSDDCDLIIDDFEVASHHLNLDVNVINDTVTLYPFNTVVYIGGEACANPQIIHSFDLIMIGETYFSIGPRGQVWPKIKVIKPNYLDPDSSVVVNDDDVTETAINDHAAAECQQLHENRKTSRLMLPMLIMFGLLLAIFSYGMLLPVQAVMTVETPEIAINNLISEAQLTDSISLKRDQDNSLILSGYVDNQPAIEKLKATVLSKYPTVSLRFWDTSDLLIRAKSILASLRADHVDVTAAAGGELTVNGYVENKSDWHHLRHTLISDVAGLVSLNDQNIYSFDEMSRLLTEHIQDNKLDQWLLLDKDRELIRVSGAVPEEQYPVWLQTLAEFRKDLGFSVDIDDKVIDAKNQKINLPVKSISFGDISYLTLKDNSKYIEGSVISDGFTVHKIYPDHIVISKNHIKYDYYIGASNE